MVRPFLPVAGERFFPSIPLAVGLFVSVFALVALCAKHSKSKLSRKRTQQEEENNRSETNSSGELEAAVAPKSPLRSPKRLLETISNKAFVPFAGKNAAGGSEEEAGVWQKNILMGDKCRPLDFSGVIYYDNYGHRVEEIPRSPRSPLAAPPSPLRTFTFPVPKTSY